MFLWIYISKQQREAFFLRPLFKIHSFLLDRTRNVENFIFQNYVGEIELLKSVESTTADVVNGQPIQYRIRFSIKNPLPKLVSIYIKAWIQKVWIYNK